MSPLGSTHVRKPWRFARRRAGLKERIDGTLAMLLAMAVVMPGVVAMMTVLVFLWRGVISDAATVSSATYVQMVVTEVVLWWTGATVVRGETLWCLGILGVGLPLGVGVGLAIVFSGYPTADHVIPSSFDEMEQRRRHVQAALAQGAPDVLVPGSRSAGVAYHEARHSLACIERALARKGFPWVVGTGYIHLWDCLYRAEEALIEVQPVAQVIAGAIRDESRLEGSNIDHSKELLDQLRRAVAVLDPSAQRYLWKAVAAPVTPRRRRP